ncbi:MAG: alpha,alpha-trehalase TreF [Bacteroidota bacterium]|nr:alpha,alpha-trehalase TreF [Bacteroidota bacterium]MDP4251366.1 alpha,alpha-trehalase TreF [Bacteroidota bacterium]
MKRLFFLPLLFPVLISLGQILQPPAPDKIYGDLFTDVQMQRIFPDGKTFVDCIPRRKPADILYDYGLQKGPNFNLKKFVEDNFEIPQPIAANYKTDSTEDVVTHIKHLWTVLRRNPDKEVEGSSLLPLPYPYIVPGGRFREVYYWDSYFTMLGLKESGETDMIENMIRNFAYLIENYGHIPNGNRTYYLGRSQPPFFSCMVELLAGIKGDSIYQTFLPDMEKEYAFWMDGADKIKPGQVYRRVVKLKDGHLLNRYWDDSTVPRQESYREDFLTAEKSGRNKIEMYQHLRAGAESGMDFSSRWFGDKKNISSIQTTDILPVDLNCLLYHLELTISKAKIINGDQDGARLFQEKAKARGDQIDKYFWNKKMSYYTDYNFKTARQKDIITPAGLYPFCFIKEHPDYLSFLGRKVAVVLKAKLLKDGGFVTTEYATGEQWDAPNGWAPLEWMMIWGLDRCGQKNLAAVAARRWIRLNTRVYKQTGKLMEKYNVVDITKEAGGGEYGGQDGFGWTNGVLLKLISVYGSAN